MFVFVCSEGGVRWKGGRDCLLERMVGRSGREFIKIINDFESLHLSDHHCLLHYHLLVSILLRGLKCFCIFISQDSVENTDGLEGEFKNLSK